MDYDNNNNEPWGWQGDDYYPQRDPHLDITSCLWDDENQNGDDLLYMLDETTPIKACTDIDYHVSESGENMNKGLEECRESSQLKRRRMLQFSSHVDDPCISDEQISSAFVKSKDRENLLMGDSLPDDALTENLPWLSSFSDGCTSANEILDPSSDGWLENCFINTDMNICSDEMNALGVSDDQVDIPEFYNIPPEIESGCMQGSATPPPRSIFKVVPGRKSYVQTPMKLATGSVAYPFALIKPCGVQGDVTLKDINQRIRTPPPSRTKHKKDEDPSPSYPTSAFSGKPVVVKTKIRTEGGKGSITITRTKG
ncbi:x-ray induced transcript 1 isoform X2 [Tasmannia lanceolata]|uniref:x-ray induced transcript 1 isoform X2 n=1 Tax=Tasmannia lanceolata TaxID=3420 RepID=UPI0040634773